MSNYKYCSNYGRTKVTQIKEVRDIPTMVYYSDGNLSIQHLLVYEINLMTSVLSNEKSQNVTNRSFSFQHPIVCELMKLNCNKKRLKKSKYHRINKF